MTITLPLEPKDEAKLVAAAQAKGISTDELVRSALDTILEGTTESFGSAMGTALVAAMQASPCRELGLDAARHRLPVRNIEF